MLAHRQLLENLSTYRIYSTSLQWTAFIDVPWLQSRNPSRQVRLAFWQNAPLEPSPQTSPDQQVFARHVKPSIHTATMSEVKPWSQKVFVSSLGVSAQPRSQQTWLPLLSGQVNPLLQGRLVDPGPFSLLSSRKEIAKSCSRIYKTILFLTTHCFKGCLLPVLT